MHHLCGPTGPRNRTSSAATTPRGFVRAFLSHARAMPRSGEISVAAAAVGATLGMGYVTVRMLSTHKGRKKAKDDFVAPKEFPMLNMEDIAKRAVPRKKSFLYTRSGDSGTSQLYNMERRAKSDAAFEALGNMDELNACLALAAEHSERAGNGLYQMLVNIQSLIIDASALVATPRDSSSTRKINRTSFPTWCTEHLEACIDELDARTPPLKTFVVPGGGLAASHLHVARCVCRRAERSLQPLIDKGQGVEEVARYINRLSDLLFAAARYASMADGKPERPWIKLPAETPAPADPAKPCNSETSENGTANGDSTPPA